MSVFSDRKTNHIVNFKTSPKSLEIEMRSTQLTSNKPNCKTKINKIWMVPFLVYLSYVFLVAIPSEYHNICKKHHILWRRVYENVALKSMLIPKICLLFQLVPMNIYRRKESLRGVPWNQLKLENIGTLYLWLLQCSIERTSAEQL